MLKNNPHSLSNSAAFRYAGVIGGGLALIGAGLAAGMFLQSPVVTVDADVAQAASAASAAQTTLIQAPDVKPVRAAQAPRQRAPVSEKDDVTPRAVAVCSTCGVVTSVRALHQPGQGTGLGAVTGGVLGGVVGNQMGKGDGKKAMTVLGVIGGGLAGHEIEKHQRSESTYEVQVRMDDGRVRTFTQPTEPSVGARMETDGDTMRVVSGAAN